MSFKIKNIKICITEKLSNVRSSDMCYQVVMRFRRRGDFAKICNSKLSPNKIHVTKFFAVMDYIFDQDTKTVKNKFRYRHLFKMILKVSCQKYATKASSINFVPINVCVYL